MDAGAVEWDIGLVPGKPDHNNSLDHPSVGLSDPRLRVSMFSHLDAINFPSVVTSYHYCSLIWFLSSLHQAPYDDLLSLLKRFAAFVLTLKSGHIDRSPGAFQGVAKSQQGSSKAGQVSPPGKQNVLGGSAILSYGTQTKGIPTYMDDFKYGFPSSGLSLQTMKWWGTDSHTETTPAKDDNGEAPESANEASKSMTDDELDWGADEAEAEADADSAITTEPSAQLCSLRRKAVDDGRKLLTGKSCGGLELCRLNKRQKMALAQVFGASLPEQLRSKLG